MTASGYVLLAGVEVGEVSMAFGAVEVVDCLLFDIYVNAISSTYSFGFISMLSDAISMSCTTSC